ncbi:MAG: hypothetical protein IT385_16930 [Deltaproteobacteria bacterium]|nr:hypothetical protein [Deltaproteobacteria bacterium]
MGKKLDQAERIHQDFASSSDADLNDQITAFQERYHAEHGRRLAMDGRRPLGPGRDRVTFRVREPEARGRRG